MSLLKKVGDQEKNETVNTFVGLKMEQYGARINDGLLRQIYGRSLDSVEYEDTNPGFF
ncbi:MAG: hypothetical protein LRZ85_04065 [Alphaproteobacteria bacterium]|nr:hypothetical protein [Alphaproteobacteria bacterium]